MSKEPKPKRSRSTKSHTAELEAKIAELEARLANLSSQVQPSAARPAETRGPPKPQARPPPPPPKPAAAPSRGTLPAGFKPPPLPRPAPEPTAEQSSVAQSSEVAPAYATISSTGYTGNKYYATRKRMSYHPPDKQYTGTSTTTTTRTAPAPPPSAPEPRPEPKVSQTRGTLPAGGKPEEKRSMWRSKGAEYENYVPEETKKKAPPSPPQQQRPAPPPPRPTASAPTHGTLPAGMKPAPKPAPQPDVVSSEMPAAAGEVAPAYATISSTGYTGNKYYATRKRMSYHPPDKQYTGSASSTTAPPAPEPPKPKIRRGTLPAGFKP